jgi:hypothetical protein
MMPPLCFSDSPSAVVHTLAATFAQYYTVVQTFNLLRPREPLEYPFHDRIVRVAHCGRLCVDSHKICLSRVLARQDVGMPEVSDRILLVRFLAFDPGFFDEDDAGSNQRQIHLYRNCYPCLRYSSGINCYPCLRYGPMTEWRWMDPIANGSQPIPLFRVSGKLVNISREDSHYGCPRIAHIMPLTFGIEINEDVVRRILARHYKLKPGNTQAVVFLEELPEALSRFHCLTPVRVRAVRSPQSDRRPASIYRHR